MRQIADIDVSMQAASKLVKDDIFGTAATSCAGCYLMLHCVTQLQRLRTIKLTCLWGLTFSAK